VPNIPVTGDAAVWLLSQYHDGPCEDAGTGKCGTAATYIGPFKRFCNPCALRRQAKADLADQFRDRQLNFKAAIDAGLVLEETRRCTFEESRPEVEQRNEYNYAYLRDWTGGENIMLYGAVGAGKSYAARCVLVKAALDFGWTVSETSGFRLISESKSRHWDKGAHHVDAWRTTRLLLIDDLDKAEYKTHELYYLRDILDRRAGNNRRTIVTANMDMQGLHEHLCRLPGVNRVAVDACLDRLAPLRETNMAGDSLRWNQLSGNPGSFNTGDAK